MMLHIYHVELRNRFGMPYWVQVMAYNKNDAEEKAKAGNTIPYNTSLEEWKKIRQIMRQSRRMLAAAQED